VIRFVARLLGLGLGAAALVAAQVLVGPRGLGEAAPDLFLAVGLAVVLRGRRGRGGGLLLGLGGLRSCFSIDPVLPTLGFFWLAGEGAVVVRNLFYGERPLVPAVLGLAASFLAPLARSLGPSGVPPPPATSWCLASATTGLATAALALGLSALSRRR